MAIEYTFIGWCKDEEKNHDKVWGVIKLNGNHWHGNYVSFWGRRGKKLQTKMYKDESDYFIEDLFYKKSSKGYTPINKDELNTVYPEFEEDLKKTTFWSMFKV